jgi:hypothetical protein
MLVPTLQLLIALSGNPTPAATSPQAALRDAIHLFESFKDDKAAAALRALLAHSPPASVAAKAHIYLALIALNAANSEGARTEFASALQADFLVDLPPGQSPKARLAFGQVRSALMAQDEAGPTSPKSPKPADNTALMPAFDTVPPAATAPAAEVERTSPSHSHVASYVLGAATLVLAGVAIYGGVEVLDFNSTVNAGNSAAAGSKPTYSNDARGTASFWAIGWPVAAGLAAAGVVGTVLAW